jgi:hypothetical protein
MSGMFGAGRTQSRHKSVEWYTPAWVFEMLDIKFDVDPCSPHDIESVVPALTKFTVFDDGLKQEWRGRVWLNPPYGRSTPFWMNRFIAHANGIALVFSRTDALWCQEALRTADACLFLAGRIQFVPGKENQHKRSRVGAGTVMFAYGELCANALERMADRGVYLRRARHAASLLEAA